MLKRGDDIIGIEVKTSAIGHHKGMASFKNKYSPHKVLLVGPGGITFDDFLLMDPLSLF